MGEDWQLTLTEAVAVLPEEIKDQAIETTLSRVFERSRHWASLTSLQEGLGLTDAQAQRLLAVLTQEVDVRALDLGDETLLVHPLMDPKEAIAEFSDQREREWRRLSGDSMPDRER